MRHSGAQLLSYVRDNGAAKAEFFTSPVLAIAIEVLYARLSGECRFLQFDMVAICRLSHVKVEKYLEYPRNENCIDI